MFFARAGPIPATWLSSAADAVVQVEDYAAKTVLAQDFFHFGIDFINAGPFAFLILAVIEGGHQ